mmetsp:Transcript_54343/g.129490  ORF Transcript_54343/g.129490 Transcript_54343/m.129490 type:complete len:257 (+) Transcript_54343:83-853(+)|eukprot:CAMPEP_0178437924 /NCGR_PEP_ID=MMETSP0689_2-20121128/35277_1 /TAXON_ID=160604 /ORGANISM="Amphidinium massartii, Strain CS-259" /LENGTH=256 /DNA_ID=CAMNT_0020060209 /DNA_START=38 /DNA_END=808 /DNA_ORIENTATION=-
MGNAAQLFTELQSEQGFAKYVAARSKEAGQSVSTQIYVPAEGNFADRPLLQWFCFNLPDPGASSNIFGGETAPSGMSAVVAKDIGGSLIFRSSSLESSEGTASKSHHVTCRSLPLPSPTLAIPEAAYGVSLEYTTECSDCYFVLGLDFLEPVASTATERIDRHTVWQFQLPKGDYSSLPFDVPIAQLKASNPFRTISPSTPLPRGKVCSFGLTYSPSTGAPPSQFEIVLHQIAIVGEGLPTAQHRSRADCHCCLVQ